jgi:predicted ATPase
MFTALHLRNFKSWADTGPIRLAPVTAFFGANSSGKSSILQSLLLLRQTTESADRNRVLDLGGANSLVDLGTYSDIVFDHVVVANALHIGVSWQESSPYQVIDLLKQARKKQATLVSSAEFGFDVSINLDRRASQVSRATYTLGDARFEMIRQAQDDSYVLASDTYDFVREQGRPWPLPPPSRFYGFPDQVRLYYQNADFLADLELKFEQACGRIHYLGPLREDPKRQYIFAGGTPSDVGKRGEFSVDALIASQLRPKGVSRGWQSGPSRRRQPSIPVDRLVAEWLAELGLIHSFELEALDDRRTLYRVQVKRTARSVPVLLTDVGFGVSQVLPVLVQLAYASPGETVVLEQPEIHLHPAVQSGLADVIIETAMARDVQVIVESHSEHLLTRLQLRIAEQTLERGITIEPSDVATYFCSQAGDRSLISELQIDAYGNIRNWPKDFFGNPLQDSVAMVQAAARRDGK